MTAQKCRCVRAPETSALALAPTVECSVLSTWSESMRKADEAGTTLDYGIVDQLTGWFRCIYGCAQPTDSRRANRFLRNGMFPVCPERSVATRTASSERKLILMDAMSQFEASDCNCSIGKRLEAFHGSTSLLDRSMILLNDVVQVL